MVNRIIISGGNFVNKGAEAMLYVTVNECFARFRGCVCCIQLADGFFEVHNLKELHDLANKKEKKTNFSGKIKKLHYMIDEYRQADLMLDVSGYELCSKLGNYPTLRYLFRIALCKWAGTKVALMPQSFGPFDYTGKYKRFVLQLINKYMSYPVVCFAREKKSAEDLHTIAANAKIEVSSDLVLQNKKILDAIKDIFTDSQMVLKKNSVGLVVNGRLYEQFKHDLILKKYKLIVDTLLKMNKNIYLLCHATDDMDICKEIKKAYRDNDNVILLDQVLSCFAFEHMAKSLEYVIAGRYHAIVHSYKECIPCIALGWAIKYQELLDLMGQNDYMLDISHADNEEVVTKIKRIDKNQEKERKLLRDRLNSIQAINCFDELESRLKHG